MSTKDPTEESAADQQEPTTSSQSQAIEPGDHLYRWTSFAGIPGLVQHHSLVWSVQDDTITIVDCEALLRGEQESYIRTIQKDTLRESPRDSPWQLVHYNAGWWRRHLNRSGTCTSVESDPPGMVLSRINFLLKHATLPSYHFLKANSECVAVWAKTECWSTLQASSFLHVTAAGQVKSATTLAMAAASQQVTLTAPAAGLWGYLGFTTTTKVSLLVTQPYLLPAIVGYGLVSVGGPIWMLHRAKHAWNETTQRLNHEFWQVAVENPEDFVDSITEWSALN